MIDQVAAQYIPAGEDTPRWVLNVRTATPLKRADGTVASYEYHRHVVEQQKSKAATARMLKGEDKLVQAIARLVWR